MALKRTPLYPYYKAEGGKTIEFGGWDMPVQFSSIKEEHEAVRTKAGLFDVSHMGEILVEGKDSLAFLQKMLTNDLSKLKIGKAQYTVLCNENGGTIDDLLVYRLSENSYFLVVNAGNTDKDFEWLSAHVEGEVTVNNVSDQYGLLAIQGPLAEEILQQLVTDFSLQELPFFSFKEHVSIGNVTALVSRSGYTGEDGFEIYCSAEDAPYIWNEILKVGKPKGLLPCGLGARDTLRFESTLPLYGQELAEDISPIEAGIGFAVKVKKETDFIGKKALEEQILHGPKRKLFGIEMIERGIARHGYKVYQDGEEVGTVTSGTFSPTLKKNLGLVLLDVEKVNLDEPLEIEIRKKMVKAKIVPTPFYKRQKS